MAHYLPTLAREIDMSATLNKYMFAWLNAIIIGTVDKAGRDLASYREAIRCS